MKVSPADLIRLQYTVCVAALYLRQMQPDNDESQQLTAETAAAYDITNKVMRGVVRLTQSDKLTPQQHAAIDRQALAGKWYDLLTRAYRLVNASEPQAPYLVAANRIQRLLSEALSLSKSLNLHRLKGKS